MSRLYTWLTGDEADTVNAASESSDQLTQDLLEIIHRLRQQVERLRTLTPRVDDFDACTYIVSESEIQEISEIEALSVYSTDTRHLHQGRDLYGKYYLCRATTQGINGIDVHFEPRIRAEPSEDEEHPEDEHDESRSSVFLTMKISKGRPTIYSGFGKPSRSIKIEFGESSAAITTGETKIIVGEDESSTDSDEQATENKESIDDIPF